MAQLFGGAVDSTTDVAALQESAMCAIRECTRQSGITLREEAEFLFPIDRTGYVAGPDWFALAVNSVRDFVVWECRPTGHVTEAEADWLMGLVGDQPTAFGRAVIFAIVREAESVPPRISELAMRATVGRCLLI